MTKRANDYAELDNHLKLEAEPAVADGTDTLADETITTGTAVESITFDGEVIPITDEVVSAAGADSLRDAIINAMLSTGKVFDIKRSAVTVAYATGNLNIVHVGPLALSVLTSAEGAHTFVRT